MMAVAILALFIVWAAIDTARISREEMKRAEDIIAMYRDTDHGPR